MIRTAFAAAVAIAVAVPAAAQGRPGPFVPLDSRLDRLVRWVIVEGGLPQVDPLTRPFRLAGVRSAFADEDTFRLTPSGRRAFAWLGQELERVSDSTAVTAEIGVGAYRNGRRDSFRAGGARGISPAGGIWASATRGPFIAVLNPAFDNRLKHDPEFTGDTARFIAGRIQTAYVGLTGERGDLWVGRMAQQWGPDLFDGLQLSPSAYPVDMLSGTLRLGRMSLTALAQRLDDYDTTLAAPVSRYFFAHRLTMRAGRSTWIALTETGIYGGPGRGFEPAFHVPLNLGLLSEVNEGKRVNLLWGAQLHTRLGGRVTLEGEMVIDDIQIDNDPVTGRRPWSGGFSLVAGTAVPGLPAHASLGYTLVRSLTWRNAADPWNVYALDGVGLGRNFADYDQLLLRLSMLPGAGASVGLDVSWIRQGSGNFRDAFPPDSILAGPGQGFLMAPVRRGAAVRLMGEAEPVAGVLLGGQIGVNGLATGTARTIASASVRLRFDVLSGRRAAAWGALAGTGTSL